MQPPLFSDLLNDYFLRAIKRAADSGVKFFHDFDIFPHQSKRDYLYVNGAYELEKPISYKAIVADGNVILHTSFSGYIQAKKVYIRAAQNDTLSIKAETILCFEPCSALELVDHSPLISIGHFNLEAVKEYPEFRQVGNFSNYNILHLAALEAISPSQLQLALKDLDPSTIEQLLHQTMGAYPQEVDDLILGTIPRGLDAGTYRKLLMHRTPIELANIMGTMFLYNYEALDCYGLERQLEAVKRVKNNL